MISCWYCSVNQQSIITISRARVLNLRMQHPNRPPFSIHFRELVGDAMPTPACIALSLLFLQETSQVLLPGAIMDHVDNFKGTQLTDHETVMMARQPDRLEVIAAPERSDFWNQI